MRFIAHTIEWAGFPEEIRSRVIHGGETGLITSYLWERGWEEEMVQGGLQSPVGKWCLGMGRFPPSDPNYWGRGTGIVLVHTHFTSLWYPGTGNHKWQPVAAPWLFTLGKLYLPHPPPHSTPPPIFHCRGAFESHQADERRLSEHLLAPSLCGRPSVAHFLKGGRRGFSSL